jgi:hypothetical protein
MTKSNHNFNLVPHYQQGELVTFRGQLFASTAAAHLFLYRHSWEIIKTGDGCRLLNVGFSVPMWLALYIEFLFNFFTCVTSFKSPPFFTMPD